MMNNATIVARTDAINDILTAKDALFRVRPDCVSKNGRLLDTLVLSSEELPGDMRIYPNASFWDETDRQIVEDLEEMFRSRISVDGLHECLEPDRIRATILPRVSSVNHIDELLAQGLACFQDLDLVFSFVIPYTESECEHAQIRVSNALLKSAGITLDEAITCAKQNAREDVSLETLSSVISNMTGMPGPADDCLWILSNSSRIYGSGVLLCRDVLQYVADLLGTNKLTILPSSVHEVLCLKDEQMDPASLLEMVTEINATQVIPEDRLTDNVYFLHDGMLEALV